MILEPGHLGTRIYARAREGERLLYPPSVDARAREVYPGDPSRVLP